MPNVDNCIICKMFNLCVCREIREMCCNYGNMLLLCFSAFSLFYLCKCIFYWSFDYTLYLNTNIWRIILQSVLNNTRKKSKVAGRGLEALYIELYWLSGCSGIVGKTSFIILLIIEGENSKLVSSYHILYAFLEYLVTMLLSKENFNW